MNMVAWLYGCLFLLTLLHCTRWSILNGHMMLWYPDASQSSQSTQKTRFLLEQFHLTSQEVWARIWTIRAKRNRWLLTSGRWLLILSEGRVTKIREDQRQKPGNHIQTLEMTAGRYKIMLEKKEKRRPSYPRGKILRNIDLFNPETKT